MSKINALFRLVIISVLLVSLAPAGSVALADYGTGSGPGGVGSVDGTSSLELWLQASEGVYTDTGCSATASDGNNVACWKDISNLGSNFTLGTLDSRYSPTVIELHNITARTSQTINIVTIAGMAVLLVGGLALVQVLRRRQA